MNIFNRKKKEVNETEAATNNIPMPPAKVKKVKKVDPEKQKLADLVNKAKEQEDKALAAVDRADARKRIADARKLQAEASVDTMKANIESVAANIKGKAAPAIAAVDKAAPHVQKTSKVIANGGKKAGHFVGEGIKKTAIVVTNIAQGQSPITGLVSTRKDDNSDRGILANFNYGKKVWEGKGITLYKDEDEEEFYVVNKKGEILKQTDDKARAIKFITDYASGKIRSTSSDINRSTNNSNSRRSLTPLNTSALNFGPRTVVEDEQTVRVVRHPMDTRAAYQSTNVNLRATGPQIRPNAHPMQFSNFWVGNSSNGSSGRSNRNIDIHVVHSQRQGQSARPQTRDSSTPQRRMGNPLLGGR